MEKGRSCNITTCIRTAIRLTICLQDGRPIQNPLHNRCNICGGMRGEEIEMSVTFLFLSILRFKIWACKEIVGTLSCHPVGHLQKNLDQSLFFGGSRNKHKCQSMMPKVASYVDVPTLVTPRQNSVDPKRVTNKSSPRCASAQKDGLGGGGGK
jgi:hypothetical protein